MKNFAAKSLLPGEIKKVGKMTVREKLNLNATPVFLMDGTAFIYRGFYANRHMRRSDGFPTNSLVIVSRVLLRILRQEQPEYFLFAMDGKGKNFRSRLYGKYKANREAMPEDLVCQIEPVKRMAAALGLPIEIALDMEADDCIASMAAKISPHLPVVIVSGDKDLKQCLGPNVFMWDPGSREDRLLTEAEFAADTGIGPAQWPDMQALIGDSSDNIPGVKGIGPKMAKQIFEVCANLEDIRAHFALLPPKAQEKLKADDSLDKMFLWRELATLRLDACPKLGLQDLRVKPIALRECVRIADEFELAAIRREISALHSGRDKDATPSAPPPAKSAPQAERERPEPAGEGEWPEIPELAILPDCANMDVGIIWTSDNRAHVAIGKIDSEKNCDVASAREFVWTGEARALHAWLGSAATVIVADLKDMLLRLAAEGRRLSPLPSTENNRPQFIDLGLASYLLAPEDGDYSWNRLSNRWREQLGCRALGPAVLAIAMGGALQKNLKADGLTPLYENLELPLAPVLARMEERGITIDPLAFQNFLDDVSREMGKIRARVFEEAGEEFNIRSSRQLAELLFGRLGLQPPQKTPGGQPSTSQTALEKLEGASPVVDSILQFRKLDKMRSTYLDPLPKLMDAHNRIHTTFNQEATATGRISSSNPNLQNIPVRGAMGKRMRGCFVAQPGKLLVAADYSQIELRILAHFSQDKNLLDAFHHDADIHARTAMIIFDIPHEEITADQRRMAKTINFGLLYGMGARKLGQELKISQVQAKNFIEKYFERLSGIKNFYETILESARKHTFVTTMSGRRRWLFGLASANGHTSAQAERQAVNTVIQGSAADIIKLAMLAVERDEALNRMGASLLLQVHDELLLECPEATAREAAERVANLMENSTPANVEMSVPLKVEWGVGQNWGEAH